MQTLEIIPQLNSRQNKDAHHIAQTIIQQIKAIGWTKTASWGMRSLKYGMMLKGKMECPYLIFKVSGFLHKGSVRVIYLPVPDNYRVELLNKKKDPNTGRMTDVATTILEEVYCDTLGDTIDEYVETPNDKGAEYAKNVNKFLNQL